MSHVFKAHAQYDDWNGTIAADSDDQRLLYELIESRGLKRDGEVVVGVSFFHAENFMKAAVYMVKASKSFTAKDYIESTEVPVLRRVSIDDLTLEEFFSFFKRVSIELEFKGLGLVGRTVETDE